MSKQNGNKGRRFDRAFKEEAVRLLQTSGRRQRQITQALHEAARVPPMDYRDNRQRWAESHQVVHFYAGQWCTFTPALTSRSVNCGA